MSVSTDNRPLLQAIQTFRQLTGIVVFLLVWAMPCAAAPQLSMTEAEIEHFIKAADAAAQWRSTWISKLGQPLPSDEHQLKELMQNGADGTALEASLHEAGLNSLDDYIALEARASDIYFALYADTTPLAVMAVNVELAVKGQKVTALERARMIKAERLNIEFERRATVTPETVDIVSRHALALARALGDIK